MRTCLCSIILPPICVFIIMRQGGRSQIQSNAALTECPRIPRVNITYPLPCVSQSVRLFLVHMSNCEEYPLILGGSVLSFNTSVPSGPVQSPARPFSEWRHTNTPSCSLTASQPPPLAISPHNMRNKAITTAEGNGRVWMKGAGRQKSSVCKEICFCQAGQRLDRERGCWSGRVFQ